MNSYDYVGGELELFADALRWKRYFKTVISPYLQGDVLEVGAGIGGTTSVLCDDPSLRWTCLEPDANLARQIVPKLAGIPAKVEVAVGTLADLPAHRTFDCILYIDVLEHIEDHRGELARAALRLRPGGTIVVLAPAHQSLYSEFDAALDHFRRYNRTSLRAITPDALRSERLIYLDGVGVLLSMVNRLMLRQSIPKPSQIRFWDRVCIPISQVLDRLTGYNLGKSIVGVWRLNEAKALQAREVSLSRAA
jgi:SAM-dependent methyltransferase